MQFLDSFAPLIDRYDAFLLDLWGVIHDGSTLYPGVMGTLGALKAAKKQVIFLSNAPRRAVLAERVLNNFGIDDSYYVRVITSGEAAFAAMAAPDFAHGTRYYFIGPDRDLSLTDGLPFTRATRPEDADFAIAVGFEYDAQTYADLQPIIEACRAANLPMLCVNPDFEVVKQSGERLLCAGYLAREYEAMGGQAEYFGKPYPAVYDLCFSALGFSPHEMGASPRILAVGDGLHTDIAGANRMGIDCAFVSGGILSVELKSPPESADHRLKVTNAIAKNQAKPNFIVGRF